MIAKFTHNMAQSSLSESPIGVAQFGEKGAQPTTTWENWFSTTKLAISTKENVQVDRLLQPRPTAPELDYSKELIYKSALPDKLTAEERQRK